jgi:hypothetical protein
MRAAVMRAKAHRRVAPFDEQRSAAPVGRAKARGDVIAEDSNGGGASESTGVQVQRRLCDIEFQTWNLSALLQSKTGGTDRWLRRKSPW